MIYGIGWWFHQVAICALVLKGDVVLCEVDDFDQAKALFRAIES